MGLALDAAKELAGSCDVRVVSMPSWELFERQDEEYRDSVFPPSVRARVVVEQAVRQGWERYVGASGGVLCMESFGVSAPLKDVEEHFGFTVENVVALAKAQLADKK